jgi:predicted nuclease with TOPRIM domain
MSYDFERKINRLLLGHMPTEHRETLVAARDEIERLRAENAKLREEVVGLKADYNELRDAAWKSYGGNRNALADYFGITDYSSMEPPR